MTGKVSGAGARGKAGRAAKGARAAAKKTKSGSKIAKRPAPPKAAPASKAAARKSRKAPARKLRPAPKPAILYHPGPLIDNEAALEEATARLLALDPAIAKLIEVGGRPPLRRQEPGFTGMTRIIVSQQLSTASANAIFSRMEAALTPLSARSLIEAEDDLLRACGLSSPKIRALRAMATAAEDGLDLAALGALSAEDAHRALVAVKGVGPWTADIFLLFCLGHPDAFPAGDLALQEAAKIALGLAERPDSRRLEEIAERWRPLRGVAARMLWAYYRFARRRSGMALAEDKSETAAS